MPDRWWDLVQQGDFAEIARMSIYSVLRNGGVFGMFFVAASIVALALVINAMTNRAERAKWSFRALLVAAVAAGAGVVASYTCWSRAYEWVESAGREPTAEEIQQAADTALWWLIIPLFDVVVIAGIAMVLYSAGKMAAATHEWESSSGSGQEVD